MKMCQAAVDTFPTLDDWRDIFLHESVELGEGTPSQQVLEAAIAEVGAGRERSLSMVRRNTITVDHTTQEIEAGKQETARLQRQLDALAHR